MSHSRSGFSIGPPDRRSVNNADRLVEAKWAGGSLRAEMKTWREYLAQPANFFPCAHCPLAPTTPSDLIPHFYPRARPIYLLSPARGGAPASPPSIQPRLPLRPAPARSYRRRRALPNGGASFSSGGAPLDGGAPLSRGDASFPAAACPSPAASRPSQLQRTLWQQNHTATPSDPLAPLASK
jgi:hypothetical protein